MGGKQIVLEKRLRKVIAKFLSDRAKNCWRHFKANIFNEVFIIRAFVLVVSKQVIVTFQDYALTKNHLAVNARQQRVGGTRSLNRVFNRVLKRIIAKPNRDPV